MQDWGRSFPKCTLQVSKDRTVLKRFATVEVCETCAVDAREGLLTYSGQDVADVVKTLVTSQSITGSNIVVDSGFCI